MRHLKHKARQRRQRQLRELLTGIAIGTILVAWAVIALEVLG